MQLVINGNKDKAPVGSEILSGEGAYLLNFMHCLGFERANPPLADLLGFYHHLEGQWLIASPVHWEASHNDAMLTGAGNALELSEEESRDFFKEVSAFLKADGFEPFYHDACTWLFRIDDKPLIQSPPPQTILHQSLMPYLDAMEHSFFWQRLITELQMYLSSHPLNAKREDKPAINGLWFWGAGQFQIEANQRLVTDDEQLLALAPQMQGQINPLTDQSILEKDQLLLIQEPEQIEYCHLLEKTKKNKTHWYWNNLAYLSQPPSWWKRLWS